jgi:hypothetical protein
MRALFGKTVAAPPAVRTSLTLIFGDGAAEAIDRVRVVEHSLFARLHGRAIATTRRGSIFLRGSAADFFDDPAMMLHEYCHVLLQWQPGSLTLLRYFNEWLRHGYWNNPFEVEARAFTREHLHRFRTHLALSRVEPHECGADRRHG